MIKAGKTIKRETGYIAAVTFILSVLMQAVFLVISKWNYTVLLGNLLSYFLTLGNFFFMGLGVQKAVTLDGADAKKMMKVSQSLRTLALFVVVVIGVVLDCFNTLAVIIPLFFPRIAIMLRPLFKGLDEKDEKDVVEK